VEARFAQRTDTQLMPQNTKSLLGATASCMVEDQYNNGVLHFAFDGWIW